MHKPGEPLIELVESDAVLAHDRELLALCRVVFDDFSADYLLDRLPLLDGRALVTARDEAGRLIGFKLGYRRGRTLFYSWLGGVHPDARGHGLARRLMSVQHEWAVSRGYTQIETRTRAANHVMIIANLKGGFRITGFEVDRGGHPVVIQRAALG
jgi:GNAT superfamily N-acetyltransferase